MSATAGGAPHRPTRLRRRHERALVFRHLQGALLLDRAGQSAPQWAAAGPRWPFRLRPVTRRDAGEFAGRGGAMNAEYFRKFVLGTLPVPPLNPHMDAAHRIIGRHDAEIVAFHLGDVFCTHPPFSGATLITDLQCDPVKMPNVGIDEVRCISFSKGRRRQGSYQKVPLNRRGNVRQPCAGCDAILCPDQRPNARLLQFRRTLVKPWPAPRRPSQNRGYQLVQLSIIPGPVPGYKRFEQVGFLLCLYIQTRRDPRKPGFDMRQGCPELWRNALGHRLAPRGKFRVHSGQPSGVIYSGHSASEQAN